MASVLVCMFRCFGFSDNLISLRPPEIANPRLVWIVVFLCRKAPPGGSGFRALGFLRVSGSGQLGFGSVQEHPSFPVSIVGPCKQLELFILL